MSKGLTGRELEMISKNLKKFDEINQAVLFGSRALGKNKKASDVDIALIGENITEKTKFKVFDILNEELPLPYFFDIIIFSTIKNKKLKENILKQGIVIFKN
ncbi:MAG: nucleotidyltransferase domain-containing protein [Calditrichaceae bacterium]